MAALIALVELYDGVVWPESAAHFVPGDYVAGMFQQHFENLEGLLLKADAAPIAV